METSKVSVHPSHPSLLRVHEFANSSNIRKAVYDRFMGVMTIEFVAGGEYDYLDVGEHVFDEMCLAESAGRYFHSNIRGRYEYFKKA